MTRTYATIALLGLASLTGLTWPQPGLATEPAAGEAADAGLIHDLEGDPSVTFAQSRADDFDRLLRAQTPEQEAELVAYLRSLWTGYARVGGHDIVAALCEHLQEDIAAYRAARSMGMPIDAGLERRIRLIDAVAAQRDAYAGRLYWHTDLDAAKQEARATGKPILSLRMLGNLDDEYSCANSRFFRTALYTDEQLGNTLRSEFVLHWQSVRPVPVITIDMGDGRVIRRTITGNSCHLVLDAEGRPVDVIPGLYGPRTFETLAQRAADVCRQIAELAPTEEDRLAFLYRYHAASATRLDVRWAELTSSVPVASEDLLGINLAVEQPDARDAGELAGGKYGIELVLIDEVLPGRGLSLLSDDSALVRDTSAINADLSATFSSALSGGLFSDEQAAGRARVALPGAREALFVGGKTAVEEALVDAILPPGPVAAPSHASAEVWEAVAAHYAQGAALDDASRRLMREKTITAEQAMAMAFSKSRVEDPLLAMVRNFEGAIALDTARNEHLLHREVHEWFMTGQAPADPDALTSRVYAELFLTPDEDPWLGLVPPDTYSALDAGGLEACEAP